MIKIRYSGFWGNKFNADTFFFNMLLKKNNIDFKVVNKGEDIHIMSCFNKPKSNPKAKLNIFYTGESRYDQAGADLKIGFRPSTDNEIQIRNYERLHFEQTGKFDVYSSLGKVEYDEDKEFCLFVVKNPACKPRNNYFDFLTKYEKVTSIGKVKNNSNIKSPQNDFEGYINLINKYKFMITFENKQKRYYVTEKIYNGMLGNSIPIYWGDDIEANSIFNPESFITVKNDKEFPKSLEEIKNIIENNGSNINGKPYVLNPKELDKTFEASMNEVLNRMLE